MRPLRFAARIAVAALLFGALPTSPSWAQNKFFSGNEIIGPCRKFLENKYETSTVFNQALCFGLIEGIMWTSPLICAPDGVIRAQSLKIVVLYIENLPARMHEDFRGLAHEALVAAWPCQKRRY